jgi:mannose/cellobiose epimerase-like protein (N-acyl-D-glucosamine 2-epimerase family)
MTKIDLTLESGLADGKDIVKLLKGLMIEKSLPLWSSNGWDPVLGGFVERLDREGRPDREASRRVRVQARQIYCFAKAALQGWYPEGRRIALNGLDYLLAKAKSPDGLPGFVHLIEANGTAVDLRRDTYDHAFILLALATVYQLETDARIRYEIDSVLIFLDVNLRSAHGGFIEGLPPALPRRQNPHMHLFEAMVALFDATKDGTFQNRAVDIFNLFIANRRPHLVRVF